MRVRAADESELVRIDTELGLHLQAVLESGADIFELQHLRLLHLRQIEVALVPAFEIRKLVVGRKKRMGLAVALDLSSLVERLPAHAVLGIFPIDPLALERLN